MDQEIRNKLRNVVTQCRKLLENDTRDSLEGRFRIYEKKGEVVADPNAPMTHLEDATEIQARAEILDHFGHVKARGFKPKEALDQLVREIAFTHLNRLCAYKMMEAREVYVGGQKFREAVSRGVNSNGVKFFLADNPEDERLFNTGHQDIAYRHFLDWLGGLLSEEIGVLFSPNDPANRLYPRQKTLDEVLNLLNEGGIKPEETKLRESWPRIWLQDETIGWVYQYFTPKELRDAARDPKKGGSQAPRNSYELAFRNQFFTPRYVVEFLTDNTLGRIWYEMRKGNTKLKDQCRYMVHRPTEIFLKEGEHPPEDAPGVGDDLSQEELLNLPLHIPHRSKKDPRELKILDPASGSGHFLLYCFDLLFAIYEEAYADPELGPALQNHYPKLEDLTRELPRLILAHNLHGIDIDLRASQIAALALWLRCQRAYQEMGLKKDRPEIKRSNFVCAEPMPGEEQLLKEFVGQIEPKLLGQVAEVVFDKMKLAGEAGSLLKIEEEIKDAVAQARKEWLAGPISVQQTLFDNDKPVVKQQRFDFSGITDAQFFEQAEGKVVDALRNYAKKADNGQRLQRRLFTDDAERGFAFVDLCHKRFDVVLMNPPFGKPTVTTKKQIDAQYPTSKHDVAACFVTRWQAKLSDGFLGVLATRNLYFLPTSQEWRKESGNVAGSLSCFGDLGFGVLDTAMVEASAAVYRSPRFDMPIAFIDALDATDKGDRLETSVSSYARGISASTVHLTFFSSLADVPTCSFCYWVPARIRRLFKTGRSVGSEGFDCRVGLQSNDDFRWLRLWWEVPVNMHARSRNDTQYKRWVPYAKGGEFSPYYCDLSLVIDWERDGDAIKRFIEHGGDSPSRYVRSEGHYFRGGLTWTQRSQIGLGVRAMPSGGIFGIKGPVLFAEKKEDLWWILATTNSRAFRGLVALHTSFGSYDTGTLQRNPLPDLSASDRERLEALSQECVRAAQSIETLEETSHLFSGLPLPQHSLVESSRQIEANIIAAKTQLVKAQSEIDSITEAAYGLDSPSIDGLFSRLVLSEDAIEEIDATETEPPNHAKRFPSFMVGVVFGRLKLDPTDHELVNLPDPFQSLPLCQPASTSEAPQKRQSFRPDSDGIIVDDPDHQEDIVRRIREVLEVVSNSRAETIEKEACEILSVRELRDYFRKPGKAGFWDDHVARYSKSRRNAPIYWLLQSSKKNYAIWLYYHRLDKDLLFKALLNYVEPKIRLEKNRLETFRSQKAGAGGSGKEAKRLDKEVERQEDFISELQDFEDKLRRAASLHLEPDLNDGVILNIAPLHELVPWKEVKGYWEELLAGKYEWSSIGKQLRQKGLVK